LSRDGTSIAYVNRITALDLHFDIYSRQIAPGGVAANLTNTNDVEEGSPAWSPDSSQIAYTRANKIFVMDRDGGNPHAATFGTQTDSSPTWSPDGTRLAFARNG